MYHSLEHVSDPRRVLTTARGWLKRGGLVVVEVPNIESTIRTPSRRFHYAHLYHFTGATLGALGEVTGLRLERTSYSEDGGNVTCVFSRRSDESPRWQPLTAPTAQTRAILREHTSLRHYLSATPYRRAAGRLRRWWRDDRLLRRLRTFEEMLHWAAGRP